ncbi:MAG: GNAT family N-acetyltransferase [Nitrospira sp.]|nr:GNAT family N-acetyltransferase [Nitrospira sp.]
MAEQEGHNTIKSHTVRLLDPLTDPRWPGFVEQHPAASVFHTRGWLRTLQTTYGYEPLAVTTSTPTERLTNALVFCVVRSWVTSDRVVSLPFTDHCEPLVEHIAQLHAIGTHLETLRRKQGWRYVEMRTSGTFLGSDESIRECSVYQWHRLDLRPNLDELYGSFHRDCIRRRIRHAERQSLRYEEGRSEYLLRALYGLIVATRLRKHLPPQPFEWFHNLVAHMGENVCLRVAFTQDRPVAGILTLNHGKTVYYKYGGSDAEFHHLGATPMLFWQAIQAAKSSGVELLDFGRSDCENRGLIRFKERWGAQCVRLTLWRSPIHEVSPSLERLKMRLAKAVCASVPFKILVGCNS